MTQSIGSTERAAGSEDRRRARGDASRRVVLEHAADIASVEGLDGLTIGRLAEASSLSKSSVAALFGGKEGLQIATVAAAAQVFTSGVIEPARAEPRGVRRVAALVRSVMDYSRDRVFTGGCFFLASAADVDSKPGPVHDAVEDYLRSWYGYLEAQLRHAVAGGQLDLDEAGAEQLAFEIISLVNEANSRSLLMGGARPYELAARSVRARLLAAGAEAADLESLGV